MTKARTLGNFVSAGNPLSDGTIAASEVTGLSTVATSGSYNDLSDKPTITTTATNIAGGSNGTIPYQSASGTTQMLAAGTAGQLLTSNGAAAPSWTTVTSSQWTMTGSDIYYTTGNVGVGTSSPAAKLTVINASDANKQIVFSNNATYYGSVAHNAGTGANEYRTEPSTGLHQFFKGTSSTADLTVNSAGALGFNSGGAPSYGSSGQVLTSGGSGAAPTWASPSSGMTLVSTINASGASSIDMPGIFTSTYDQYMIFIENLRMSATTTCYLYFYIGGTLFTNANYGSQLGYMSGGWGQLFSTSGQNQGYFISSNWTLDAPAHMDLVLTTTKPLDTNSYKQVSYSGNVIPSNSGASYPHIGAIGVGATGTLTGLKMTPNAGTISGTVRIYGLAN